MMSSKLLYRHPAVIGVEVEQHVAARVLCEQRRRDGPKGDDDGRDLKSRIGHYDIELRAPISMLNVASFEDANAGMPSDCKHPSACGMHRY